MHEAPETDSRRWAQQNVVLNAPTTPTAAEEPSFTGSADQSEPAHEQQSQ